MGLGRDTATVPQFSEAGTWNVRLEMVLMDAAGNYQDSTTRATFRRSVPHHPPGHFGSRHKPAGVTSFTFSPQSVDVTNGSATVNVTVQATDDLSGVQGVGASWISPDGANEVSAGLDLSSGTTLNGTWTGPVTVPQFVEAGTWSIW